MVAAVATVATMVALTAWRGALGASRNDDWGLYRVAYRLARDGEFVLDGWGGMFFLGQALLAAPVVRTFGEEPAPLQLLVAATGVIGLVATYLLVRGFLSRGRSLVAVACLVVGPLFGPLAVTFMTDVPTFAFSMAALLLASWGATRPRPLVWLVASLVVATFAFTIREYAVVAGVAALGVHLLHAPARRRVVAVGVGWLLVVGALLFWRSGLEHTVSFQVDLSPGSVGEAFVSMCAAVLTLAFFVSPVLLAVSVSRLRCWVGARWWPAMAVALAVMALAIVGGGGFVGNYMSPNGPGSGFWPGTPSPVMSGFLLVAAGVVAVAATAVLVALAAPLVAELWRRLRAGGLREVAAHALAEAEDRPVALVVASMYALLQAGLMAATLLLLDAPFFDRYLISLVPILAAVVLWTIARHDLGRPAEMPAPRRWLAPVVAAVVLGWCGAAVADGTAARDGLAWELAQHLEDEGVVADRIEGGPWAGYHQADWWTRADQLSTACSAVRHRDGRVQGVMVRTDDRRTFGGTTFGLEAVIYDGQDPDCGRALPDG
jgi:hypothetical protein